MSVSIKASNGGNAQQDWRPIWKWVNTSGFRMLLVIGAILIVVITILAFTTADLGVRATILAAGIPAVLTFVVVVIQAAVSKQMAEIMERQEAEMTEQRKAMQGQLTRMENQEARMVEQRDIMQAQFEVMKQQATIALRQLETTDRPWIVVDATLTGPLTFDKQGIGRLDCQVIARNIGRSVAVNTSINAKTVIPIREGVDSSNEILKEQADVCKNIYPFMGSFTLFPMDVYSHDYGFAMSPQDLERGRLKIPNFEITNVVDIYIVGCVNYQMSGQDAWHQTRFVYEVKRAALDNTRISLCIEIGTDLPLNELLFRRANIVGGEYAN